MSITIEKIEVLAFKVIGADRLDPVQVMIENIEPGRGTLTITCFDKAWNAAWGAMGGGTVQDFIKIVNNDYLIDRLSPGLCETVDDDNDANLRFVKSEILNYRRHKRICKAEAREMWEEAENAEDVKTSCCEYSMGNVLLSLFDEEPWYANWPSVPNHEYKYLERILNAVRAGLAEMER